jgi:hypothetical protein
VYSLKDESEIFWCFEALMKKLGMRYFIELNYNSLEYHFAEDSIQDKLSRFMMYFRSVHPELYPLLNRNSKILNSKDIITLKKKN